MKVYFTDILEYNSFELLLFPKRIFWHYCNNPDGNIYAKIITDNKSKSDVVKELISKLNPVFITKKNVIILNLLVNPYFDELCLIISSENNISKRKKSIIKKYIFVYLSSEKTKKFFSDSFTVESKIYQQKNLYMISKKILNIL